MADSDAENDAAVGGPNEGEDDDGVGEDVNAGNVGEAAAVVGSETVSLVDMDNGTE